MLKMWLKDEIEGLVRVRKRQVWLQAAEGITNQETHLRMDPFGQFPSDLVISPMAGIRTNRLVIPKRDPGRARLPLHDTEHLRKRESQEVALHRLMAIIITTIITDLLLGKRPNSPTRSMPNTEPLDDVSIAERRAT